MPEPGGKPAHNEPWGDLVVSILAVNRYPLERTYSSLDLFRQKGLADPKQLAHLRPEDIADRLVSAGYNRGEFMTSLFALRLCSLGVLAEKRGTEFCTKIISSADRESIKELLLAVNGVGPRVLANFFLLRGI
jgi:hypothetical protein